MKDSKEYRSVVITVDNHNYVFHANGYRFIHGSMDHWSLATADRIYLLYQRYEDIIINILYPCRVRISVIIQLSGGVIKQITFNLIAS